MFWKVTRTFTVIEPWLVMVAFDSPSLQRPLRSHPTMTALPPLFSMETANWTPAAGSDDDR